MRLTYKTLKGSQINNTRLKHWESLFKQWQNAVNHYCNIIEGDDAPFFYTERANVSTLAVAAWKAGWLSLQEFSIGKRGKSIGRCDLYFYIDELEREEYIEAKLAWSFASANSMLANSLKDAKKIAIKNTIRIGLTFICPEIHEKYESDIDKKINELIDKVKLIDCDALSYVFPDSTRNLKGANLFKHIIYPGIFILAKEVR